MARTNVRSTIGSALDSAADLPVLVASTAVRLPVVVRERYAEARRAGVLGGVKIGVTSLVQAGFAGSRKALGLATGAAAALRRSDDASRKAVQPVSLAARRAGAPGAATAEAEAAEREAATRTAIAEGTSVDEVETPVPAHDELPLPNYDHMTIGSLRARLRALSMDDLLAIRTYEKAHANRLQVVTMLENRIARLRERDGDVRHLGEG